MVPSVILLILSLTWIGNLPSNAFQVRSQLGVHDRLAVGQNKRICTLPLSFAPTVTFTHSIGINSSTLASSSRHDVDVNNSINSKSNNNIDYESTPFPNSLDGCVCVVTGASRGIGKGIALELGAAGATVYITGTSTATSTSSSNGTSGDADGDDGNDTYGNKFVTNENVGGPGTIEQTATEINSLRGKGKGIPFYCDHSNDTQVKQLFDHIQTEHGRLDILINNVFRVPNGGTKALFGNFWENESSIETWDAVHTVGLRSHYVATRYALPIMIQNQPKTKGKMNQPFVAMISSFGGTCYSFNTAYGVGKAGVDRLAKDVAYELQRAKENIHVMSFYPGLVYTERTEESVNNGSWEEDVGIPVDNAETPRFTGRSIIAVATDPSLYTANEQRELQKQEQEQQQSSTKKSGSFQVVAELAQEYGFTDENGKQPPSIRSLKFLIPAYGMDKETREKVPSWLIPDIKLPFFIMANGAPPED